LIVKSTRRIKNIGLCALLSCLTLQQVHAAVFENKDLTPAGAGAANAVVAGTGNLSDAFYNPAGLAWQDGVQAVVGNQSLYRHNSVEFGGSVRSGNEGLPGVSMLAISWKPKGLDWGISGSISTPFVGQNDWSASFPSLKKFDLKMQRYSADVIWRATNVLGVAMGLDIYDAGMALQTGGSSFSGSDWSDIGVHLGLRWEFVPFWTLGAHYRQGVNVSMSNWGGDVAKIQLPDELSIGLAHIFDDDEMLLELDVKRSTWSSLQSIDVLSQAGITLQSNVTNLRDTTDAMLGLTWFWQNNTHLRFGYAYEQGANPMAGYQPLLSDLTGHKMSIGFGGMAATMHLDMTWTGTYYARGHATGAYPGAYGDMRNSFMFSLTKKF
jgi:long-subunit fatty acid transport protein